MSENNDKFLDDDYEVPVSAGGYMKLVDGDNPLRILSNPLLMWSEWREGKKINHPFDRDNKPAKGGGKSDSVKHGWGLVVYNYTTGSIEVFELDKQEVISQLTAYSKDKEWGHPKEYDIVIKKSGTGLDTDYTLICKPPKDASQEVVDAFLENPIDLSQLLVENGSPFMTSKGDNTSTQKSAQTSKKVTPDNWTEGDDIPEGYEVKNGKLKKKMPF